MKKSEKRSPVSSPEKIMFPEDDFNKADIVTYYRRIYKYMEPHVANRLLMLQRFPGGIDSGGFYQKEVPEYFPDWIDRATVDKKEGGEITQVICNSVETAAYLANQACITFHSWLSRAGKPGFPDKIILDLDPPGRNFDRIRQTLPMMKAYLEEKGLKVFLMTTGSKGLHIIIPVVPEYEFRESREIAGNLADNLETRCRNLLTTSQSKRKRGHKIYLDIQRNSYGQTGVSPYSLRPLKGAPVATPVKWDETLQKNFTPGKYHLRNIFRRLSRIRDPWENFFDKSLAASNSRILFAG